MLLVLALVWGLNRNELAFFTLFLLLVFVDDKGEEVVEDDEDDDAVRPRDD